MKDRKFMNKFLKYEMPITELNSKTNVKMDSCMVKLLGQTLIFPSYIM